jgi:UDP-N-acetylmuramoyl-tripeptide--D-alanyl-D-alanine ligase
MSGMNWALVDVVRVLDCYLVGAVGSSLSIQRIVTDSRQIQAGDCFVALMGERVDGHDFLAQVMQAGAVAAIVTHYQPDCALPQLVVDDAIVALQRLAGAWRSGFQLSPCIAVTGSNGKTSVKEMLASVLRVNAAVLATQGNLNNHLGLPMTLLALRAEHQAAVIEVGANHLGEIAVLAPLAQPDTAIISSIGAAHIGEFGSFDAIIRAKGELLAALPANGLAVIPAISAGATHDDYAVWYASLVDKRVVVFGDMVDVLLHGADCDYVGVAQRHQETMGQRIELVSNQFGSAEMFLPLLGAHQARNAAAVAAALLAHGVGWQEIQQGLSALSLPGGRLRVLQPVAGLVLIDDSYNANPASMVAAIAVLMEQPAQQHLLVLGAMGELGEQAQALHLDVARAARKAGVTQLWAMGSFATGMVDTFGSGVVAEDVDVIAQQLWQTYLQSGSVAVLVKGSRSSKMERVVMALEALAVEENKK